MRKNHWLMRLGALLLVSYTVLVVGVMASGGPGSEGDPLVTVSYLNDTFMQQLLSRVDEKLVTRDKELSDKLDAQIQQGIRELPQQSGDGGNDAAEQGSDFIVVTLSQGQTLYGDIGCEAMLRVGAASCVTPSTPGLIDETDATVLSGGEKLVQNHLYMMTIDGRGIRADAATVKLLVRGGYSVQ